MCLVRQNVRNCLLMHFDYIKHYVVEHTKYSPTKRATFHRNLLNSLYFVALFGTKNEIHAPRLLNIKRRHCYSPIVIFSLDPRSVSQEITTAD